MESKQIFLQLNDHLKIVQKNYPIKNIFGIFVVDYTKDKEIKSEAVVIPTFEEICTSIKSITHSLTDNIVIYDAREIYKATASGHPELLEALYTEYRIVNPIYEHIFQKAYLNHKKQISAGVDKGIPAPELKAAMMRLLRTAWGDTSNIICFIKQLTDVEKLALNAIVNKIGDEGVFSQAKLASEAGVSRLTMSNLIMKIKLNNIATVEYMGNKGTYLKFLDDIVLNIGE